MKIAIFASGVGGNAKAIIEATRGGGIENAEVVAVISDKIDAPALEMAQSCGIESAYINPMHKGARMSPEAAENYINAVKKTGANLIVLAGFMRIVPPEFIEAFPNSVINLHPSLLPLYKGKDAIRQAFEAGETKCGCSVHFVTNELDGGKIIGQRTVEILSGDTLEDVEKKVHEAEHVLLPYVINKIAAGEIKTGLEHES